MSLLSIHFSRALARGRAAPQIPASREALLVSLLNKRAVAWNMGADELEAMLRQQILWSLPTVRPVDVGMDAEIAA
jgi:hypothetical protein